MRSHAPNQRKAGQWRKLLPLCLAVTLLGAGCVYSLHPWYAAGTGGSNPALQGVWRPVETEDAWVFLAEGDSLALIRRETGKSSGFSAVTFVSGGVDLLDLVPAANSLPDGPAAAYLMPMHEVLRWRVQQDTLFLRSLDVQAMRGRLEAMPHPPVDSREEQVLFTGTRDEMVDYLNTQLLDSALWSEPTRLVRE